MLDPRRTTHDQKFYGGKNMKRKEPVCNKDCFHCPFPDCINDELDYDDYKAEEDVEELLHPKTTRQEKVAAWQRAYREANREKVAARQRAYYEANREKVAAQKTADLLRVWRKEHGYTQRSLARLCGLTQSAISQAEAAMIPLPEPLRAMMGGGAVCGNS